MKSLALICALFSAAQAQYDFTPGIKSGMANSVINQGKNAYFNAVMMKLNGIQIPDIVSSDGKSYMKQNTFTYLSTANNVDMYTDVTNNAMVLACNKVTAKFYSGDYRYHYAPGLNVDGTIEVDLNTIEFDIGLGFANSILPDGREVPSTYGVDTLVKINRFDLKVHATGGFDAWMIDAVMPFIKGMLCDVLEQTLYSALNVTMPNEVNKLFVKSDGFLPLPHQIRLDFETPSAAIVSNEAFMFAIKGDIFDLPYGEIDPMVAIPSMPNFDATRPEGYQNYVSTFSMDTIGSTITEEATINGWVNGAYATTITTGSLNPFLPGIAAFYGDVPVAINWSIHKLGSFGVTEANPQINALTTLNLDFYAMTATGPELATSMTLQDTFVGFTVMIDNMTCNIQLATTNVDKITVNSCAFGKLSTILLKTELNNFFRIFTPIINNDLANSAITVPSNLGFFTLTNLTLGYYNDFLYVGMTPVFNAPVSAVEEQLALFQ